MSTEVPSPEGETEVAMAAEALEVEEKSVKGPSVVVKEAIIVNGKEPDVNGGQDAEAELIQDNNDLEKNGESVLNGAASEHEYISEEECNGDDGENKDPYDDPDGNNVLFNIEMPEEPFQPVEMELGEVEDAEMEQDEEEIYDNAEYDDEIEKDDDAENEDVSSVVVESSPIVNGESSKDSDEEASKYANEIIVDKPVESYDEENTSINDEELAKYYSKNSTENGKEIAITEEVCGENSVDSVDRFIADIQNIVEMNPGESETEVKITHNADEDLRSHVSSSSIEENKMSPFVDESIGDDEEIADVEDAADVEDVADVEDAAVVADAADVEEVADVEPNKPEEKSDLILATGTIELETADPSTEASDDELDIDKSLEACLDDLEKNIEEEEDEMSNSEVPTREMTEESKETEPEKGKDVVESSVDNSVAGTSSDADDEGDSTKMSTENNSEAEEPNDEEALASLAQIEKNTKRILDEDWTEEGEASKKRATEDATSEPVVKKAKLDEEINPEKAEVKKKIKKSLRKMKRSEMEEIIATKCVELLTNKSEVGKLRQQVDSYQDTVERWKRRAGALSKQCTDLSTVMRKYITDSKTRGKEKVIPVRITRSVGLQVMSPEQRRLQQQRQSASRLTKPSPSPSPQPRAVAPGASSPTARPATSPATRQTPSVGGLVPGSVTITPTKATTSATVSQPKKAAIDVVDLSDDDSPAPRPAPQQQQQLVRPNILRGGVPLSRPRAPFRTQQSGNQLFNTRTPQSRPSLAPPRLGRPALGTKAHPAPLPPMPNPQPNSPTWKLLPPRPALKISRVANGIVLSWNMNLNLASHAGISSYQLYAYQESTHQRPDPSLWKKVGDVKALPLPMACTLTQFMRGNKYHFAVRAMDNHSRVGQFSEPNSILLN